MNKNKNDYLEKELKIVKNMLEVFEKSIIINSINSIKIKSENEKIISILISFNTNVNNDISFTIDYYLHGYEIKAYSSKIDLNFFKNFEDFEYQIKEFIFKRENYE